MQFVKNKFKVFSNIYYVHFQSDYYIKIYIVLLCTSFHIENKKHIQKASLIINWINNLYWYFIDCGMDLSIPFGKEFLIWMKYQNKLNQWSVSSNAMSKITTNQPANKTMTKITCLNMHCKYIFICICNKQSSNNNSNNFIEYC